jgi:hypothetical protein
MAILVDTKLLVCRLDPAIAQRSAALDSVDRLLANAEPAQYLPAKPLRIVERHDARPEPQRSRVAGRGGPAELDWLERIFSLLPDRPEIHAVCKRLVLAHQVIGPRALTRASSPRCRSRASPAADLSTRTISPAIRSKSSTCEKRNLHHGQNPLRKQHGCRTAPTRSSRNGALSLTRVPVA